MRHILLGFLLMNTSIASELDPVALQDVLAKSFIRDDGALAITDQENRFVRRRPNETEISILKNAVEHWRIVFDKHIETVAPTPKEQRVLLRTFETLPPNDYLEMVLVALGSAESKTIDRDAVFQLVLGQAEKDGFVAFNYDDPRVQLVLEEALELCEDNEYRKLFQDAKNGELARNVVIARQNSGRQLPVKLTEEQVDNAGKGQRRIATDPVAQSGRQNDENSEIQTESEEQVKFSSSRYPVWPYVLVVAALI